MKKEFIFGIFFQSVHRRSKSREDMRMEKNNLDFPTPKELKELSKIKRKL